MGLKFALKSSSHVLSVSNRIKMLWIDAHRTTAEVVKAHPFGDSANDIFVGDPVGKTRLAGAVSQSSVSVGVNAANPVPALSEMRRELGHAALPIHLGPETFFPSLRSGRPVAVPPSHVVVSAHPTANRFSGASLNGTGTIAHINTSNVLVGAGRLDTAPVHLILAGAA